MVAKKLAIVVAYLCLVMMGACSADTFDVTEEVITTDKAKIDIVIIRLGEKRAEIELLMGYEDEESFVYTDTKELRFKDRVDNPDTLEIDETDTSYTDLLNVITIDKPALRQLLKSRL